MFDFIPMSLMNQFKRFANIYFLSITVLQCIEIISPLNPLSAIMPLVFILSISMVREGIDDYSKHKSDLEMNQSQCFKYKNLKKRKDYWSNLQVGDIVRIEDDQFFPCDIIPLCTGIKGGICYIQTASIDGETNLKKRVAPLETSKLYYDTCTPEPFDIQVTAPKPDAQIYEFKRASLIIKKRPGEDFPIEKEDQKISMLTVHNLLPRGAKLKNSQYIIGIVVYTGRDSKIMQNAESSRYKQSNVEKKVNKLIFTILMIQVLLSFILFVFSLNWNVNISKNHHYIGYKDTNAVTQSILNFFTYFLLLNTMIPISLIVTLEVVKGIQAYLMSTDKDMYVSMNDKYCKPIISSINEELGQIEYIFSDKTGTLTQNKMGFKMCLIGNEVYGQEKIYTKKILKKKSKYSKQWTKFKNINKSMRIPVFGGSTPKSISLGDFQFHDNKLFSIIQGKQNNQIQLQIKNKQKVFRVIKDQSELVDHFFTTLATNHDNIVEVGTYIDEFDDGTIDCKKLKYQGSSPDCVCLTMAAKNLGYAFNGVVENDINLIVKGKKIKYKVLDTFEFTSARKRSSVILQHPVSNEIFLYSYGADSEIERRLNMDEPQPFLKSVLDQCDIWSALGHRTLFVAFKQLTVDDWKQFSQSIEDIKTDPDYEAKRWKLIDDMEQELFGIGATCVEDKLQYRVPETIHSLLKANIKVWMLTGDKLGTAENIAKSCKLINSSMHITRLKKGIKASIENFFKETQISLEKCKKENKKQAILIEGDALKVVLDKSKKYDRKFLEIAQKCHSVVVCRCTPKQKAKVVRLVKQNTDKITLAIGDGANDVNMIQEAHIGIGIYGNEGLQAVQSCDYAIGEFRCLWRLVLVHGRWSYIRIVEMILYFFYKNIIFTVPQIYFAFENGFSGQSFFESGYVNFYNVLFTAYPLLAKAIFEQDVNYKRQVPGSDEFEEVENLKNIYPELYYVGQENELFDNKSFWKWCLGGAMQSLFIWVICIFQFPSSIMSSEGYNSDLVSLSVTYYTCIILNFQIVDIKLVVSTRFQTKIFWFALIFTSIGVYILYMFLYDFISTELTYKTITMLLSTPQFYTVIVCLCLISFIMDVFYYTFKISIVTSVVDYVRMVIKYKQEDNETVFKNLQERKKNYFLPQPHKIAPYSYDQVNQLSERSNKEDQEDAQNQNNPAEKELSKNEGKQTAPLSEKLKNIDHNQELQNIEMNLDQIQNTEQQVKIN